MCMPTQHFSKPLDCWLGCPCSLYRLMEFEADAIGLQLMAAACYDPKAAQSMMQKMCHIVSILVMLVLHCALCVVDR